MSEGPNKNFEKQLLNKKDGVLFFRCKNERDLAVLSSLLQDAMINNLDFHFSKKEKTFLFVANRFCWENVASKTKEKAFQRVISGVNIQNVTSVKHKISYLKMMLEVHYFIIYSRLSMTVKKVK